ncbi:hypothetical protein BC834DRAFT_890714, partial [Gloeopeniophorella convolvens]
MRSQLLGSMLYQWRAALPAMGTPIGGRWYRVHEVICGHARRGNLSVRAFRADHWLRADTQQGNLRRDVRGRG